LFTCPAGSDVVLIANATDEMVRVNVAVAVCGERLESLTWKVTGVFVADTEGTPETAPLEALRESPEGNAPLTIDQV
jgi:hypothetical protein